MRRVFALMLVLSALPGCAALFPRELDIDQRLAAIPTAGAPVEAPVEIRWNDHQVPWITAESDGDLAFALGLVHGHLRLAQIHLLKRVSQGRLSESAGPFTRDIDHALRMLDYGHAAEAVLAAMPTATRIWLDRFVAGLNHYQASLRRLPPEFGLLGLEPEPFTATDVITIGRLAGTDVNWLAYFGLLERRLMPEWPGEWQRALVAGGALPDAVLSETGARDEAALLQTLLAGLSRNGSNSFAVAPEKSASGAAMIANDPHLGLNLPNLWLLVGLRSPDREGVGMMVPGIPLLALGRTPHMAWGGTNMRAASSDLYDVTNLPAEQKTAQTVRIGTRLWPDSDRTVRRTPLGPILSDSKFIRSNPGEEIALRWVGHEPTDEISSFLDVTRARSPEAFREAFRTFGVSAQNMVFADASGNIGHVLATWHPIRPYDVPPALVLPGDDPAVHWQAGYADSRDLPMLLNPEVGFVASGNNKPRFADRTLGYFFSPDDRVDRMAELAQGRDTLSVEDLKALQQDVSAPAAHRMARGLTALIDALPHTADGTVPADHPIARAVAGWDGHYTTDSRGAVAFETLLYHVVLGLYGGPDGAPAPGIYTQWRTLQQDLVRDLEQAAPSDRATLLAAALAAAERDAAAYPTWGDMHRLRVGHVLQNIPGIGRFFQLSSVPVGGSRETVMKTAHGMVREQHRASYGSQSRHISDMSDPDHNWFALLGGQDGWLGSSTFADQVPLWRDGRYIRLPLRRETIVRDFPHLTTVSPR